MPSHSEGDVRDLGFHLKWNMGFTYDAVSLFSAEFNERPQLETFGWKRLAWSPGAVWDWFGCIPVLSSLCQGF